VGAAAHQTLLLADSADNTTYEITFPEGVHFATPFLAGLSPDAYSSISGARWIPSMVLSSLKSPPDPCFTCWTCKNVVISLPITQPSFPVDLERIADLIKDEWSFTNFDYSFEE
jgi:hypothetical protein